MFENKYPYTDFHELNLDWFLAEFKKVHDHVDSLDATVHEFTEFVTNYFENLDVQEEINNKLNAMAADGSLSALIQPLFDEYKTEIDGEISDQFDVLNSQNGRITTLEARMDTFSHLTEGSTTGDAELADIRVGYNGITYPTAGDAVRGQIGDISDQLIWNNSFNVFKTPAFNSTSGTYRGVDYTYDPVLDEWSISGTATGVSRYAIFGDITQTNNYIVPGKKYYVKLNQVLQNCNIQIAMRFSTPPDDVVYTNQTTTYTAPDRVYTGFIIRFEVPANETVNLEHVKVSLLSAESNAELTDAIYTIKEEIEYENFTEITVKQDGTGDYTSIRPAVASIADASDSNKYKIKVYPGTYDIMSEFTDEEIADAQENDLYGILLTDGIYLEGVGDKNDIVLTAELDPDIYSHDLRNMFSVINITGNSGISNMTMLSNNIRYCIHDSFNSSVGFYKHTFSNLVLRCLNSTASAVGRSYGCGIMAPGCDISLENVDFGSDFVIHSNAAISQAVNVYIKNCRGNVANCESISNHVVNHTFRFENCSFQGVRMKGYSSNNLIIESNDLFGSFLNDEGGSLYVTGDIVKIYNIGIQKGYAVSKNRNDYTITNEVNKMFGIVVNEDAEYTYIQRTGHINVTDLGITGIAQGDYVGLNASGKPAKVNDYASAFGYADYKDSSTYYVKIR